MQAVFEKIIEKLNSKKAYFQRFYECEGKSEHDADLNKSTQLAFDDAIEIVKQEAEQYNNAIIDGKYCFQSCACTEKCDKCSRLRNGDIDWYENIDNWT